MKRNGLYLIVLVTAGAAGIGLLSYWNRDDAFAESGGETSHAGHSHGTTSSGTGAPLGLTQLEALRCEHDIRQMDCDECRYELGIVRIAEGSPAAALLKTQAAELRIMTRTLGLMGHVELDLNRTAEVAAIGGGRVETIHKRLGDAVQAGETLAVLHSPEFGRAKTDYLEAAAQWDLVQTTFRREEQLHDNKVSSAADFQQARNEYRRAQASFIAAERLLEGYGLTVEQIEELRQTAPNGDFYHLSLTAPFSGTILRQNFIQGQGVETDQSLYRISDLGRVWVICHVPESALASLDGQVRSGKAVTAEIRVRAIPDIQFRGSLDRISDEVEETTRSIEVRFVVSNEDLRLKPGMFAQVDIEIAETESRLAIPTSAILTDEGTAFVFCRLKDDLWIRRSVSAGADANGYSPILDGLNETDIVVIEGGLMLKSDVLREKMGAGCAH